jgi:hypothetical protein
MPDIASIPDLVKSAILKVAGFTDPDPSTLDDTVTMSGFNFTFFNFSDVTVRFDQIAATFKPGATVKEADVQNCKTVKDCVGLVQKAVTQ